MAISSFQFKYVNHFKISNKSKLKIITALYCTVMFHIAQIWGYEKFNVDFFRYFIRRCYCCLKSYQTNGLIRNRLKIITLGYIEIPF